MQRPPEGNFFSGTVTYFSAHTGEHTVRYDDGDAEEVGLACFFPRGIMWSSFPPH